MTTLNTARARSTGNVKCAVHRSFGTSCWELRKIAFGAAILGLAATWPALSSAQTAPAPGNTEAPMLQEVVVTALKQGPQELVRTAAAISVISGREIDAMQATSLKDFLQLAPGVSIDDGSLGPGTTQIQIRGLNSDFGSSTVGFYIDDMPFSILDLNYLPDISPFDLSQVEVLKGPQGTLYGAGSAGGVVLVKTEDPNMHDYQVEAETSGSSTKGGGGNYTIDSAINLPIVPDKMALRLDATYDNESGWINSPLTDTRDINGSDQANYRAKLRLTPTDQLTVQLLTNVSHLSYGGTDIADDRGNYPNFDNFSYGGVDYDIYGGKISYKFPLFTVTSTTGYMNFENTNRLTPFPGATTPVTVAEHSLAEEVRLNSTGTGPFSWVTGVFYSESKEHFLEVLATSGLPFNADDDIPAHETNIYAQGTLALLDRRIEITAGGSYFTSQFTDNGNLAPVLPTPLVASQATHEFNPKLSLAYHPTEHSTLYATYSQGLRMGLAQPALDTFSERAVDPTATGTVGPEIDHAYEVGAKGDFLNGRLHAEGDLFLTHILGIQESAAVAVPGSSVPVNTILNAGDAQSKGLELLIAAEPVTSVTVSVSGSYADATISKNFYAPIVGGGVSNIILFHAGDPLTLVPKVTLNGTIAWSHPVGSLTGTASITAQYSSARYLTQLSLPPIGGNAINRVDLRYQIGRGSWRVFAFVNNVTNDEGAISPTDLDAFIPPTERSGILATRQRPRTIGAGVSVNF
jgi:iron complex outermembrane recepter protein